MNLLCNNIYENFAGEVGRNPTECAQLTLQGLLEWTRARGAPGGALKELHLVSNNATHVQALYNECMSTLSAVGGTNHKAQFVRQDLKADQWRNGNVPPPPPAPAAVPTQPPPPKATYVAQPPATVPSKSAGGGEQVLPSPPMASSFAGPALGRSLPAPPPFEINFDGNPFAEDFIPDTLDEIEDCVPGAGLERKDSSPVHQPRATSSSSSACDEPRSLSAGARPRNSSPERCPSDSCERLSDSRPRSDSTLEKYDKGLAADIVNGCKELPDDQLERKLIQVLDISSITAREILKNCRPIPAQRPGFLGHSNRSEAASRASKQTDCKSNSKPKDGPQLTPKVDSSSASDVCSMLEVADSHRSQVSEDVRQKRAPPEVRTEHIGHDSPDAWSDLSAAAHMPSQKPSSFGSSGPVSPAQVTSGNSAVRTEPELLKLPDSDHRVDVLINACNMFPQCQTLGSIMQLITDQVLDNSARIFAQCPATLTLISVRRLWPRTRTVIDTWKIWVLQKHSTSTVHEKSTIY